MSTTRLRWACVALCFSAGVVSPQPASGGEADVLARVAETEVTRDEVRAYLRSLGIQEQTALARNRALLSQAVRNYLARRLVVKAAQAKSFDQQPAVKAQLERARDEALAELYLQSVTEPPADYPSDAEVQAAYAARAGAFDAPAQYRLAQIFIGVDKRGYPQAEEKARERLDVVVEKLTAKDADFVSIARERSDERASAEKGGEIGWLAEAELIPAIRPSVLALSKGAVTAPIRLDDGWHLVKLLDTRPAARRPLAEVRAALEAQLRAERAQAKRKLYLTGLLQQSPPEINELMLSSLLEGR